MKNTIPIGNGNQTVDQTYTDPKTGVQTNSRVTGNGLGGYQRWTNSSDDSANYVGKDTQDGPGYVQAYNHGSSTSGTPDYVIGAQGNNWNNNVVSAYDRHGNLTGVQQNSIGIDGHQHSTYIDPATNSKTLFGDQPDGKGGVIHGALTGQINKDGQGWENDADGHRWNIVPTRVDEDGHQAPMMWRTQTDKTGTHTYYQTPQTDDQGNVTGFLQQDDFTGTDPKNSYQQNANADGTITRDDANGTRTTLDQHGNVLSVQTPPDTRSGFDKAWDTVDHWPGAALGAINRTFSVGFDSLADPMHMTGFGAGDANLPNPDVTFTGIGKGLIAPALAPLQFMADTFAAGLTVAANPLDPSLVQKSQNIMHDGPSATTALMDAATLLPLPEFQIGERILATMARLGIYRVGSRTSEELLIDALVAEGRNDPEIIKQLQDAGTLGQEQRLTDAEVMAAIQQSRDARAATQNGGLAAPNEDATSAGSTENSGESDGRNRVPGLAQETPGGGLDSMLNSFQDRLSAGIDGFFGRISSGLNALDSFLKGPVDDLVPLGPAADSGGGVLGQMSAAAQAAGDRLQQALFGDGDQGGLFGILSGGRRSSPAALIGPGEEFEASNGITYGRDEKGRWYGYDETGAQGAEKRFLPDGAAPTKNGLWHDGHSVKMDDWAKTGRRNTAPSIPKADQEALETGTPPADDMPTIGPDHPELTVSGLGNAPNKSGVLGKVGDAYTRARIKMRGLTIVAEEPWLPIPGRPGKYFKPDFLCVDKEGNVVLVESKFNRSGYQPGQYSAYNYYRNGGDYDMPLQVESDKFRDLLEEKYGIKPGSKVTRVETYRWNGDMPDGGPGIVPDDPTVFYTADNYFPDKYGSVVRSPDDNLEFADSMLRGYSAVLQEAADRAAVLHDPREDLYQFKHDTLEGLLNSAIFPEDQLLNIVKTADKLSEFGVKELDKLLQLGFKPPTRRVGETSALLSPGGGAVDVSAALQSPPEILPLAAPVAALTRPDRGTSPVNQKLVVKIAMPTQVGSTPEQRRCLGYGATFLRR
ncbi:hypothetical protein [Nocardia sp. NBC_01327]|uniref:hypothetical protein n=1 Tax=Nocardia sp. NBC_01327 TaxID=2903593 RepID=UPI002E148737|nr:hypothetical protein OG326_34930 [Nocardia sp. NBC_01327]